MAVGDPDEPVAEHLRYQLMEYAIRTMMSEPGLKGLYMHQCGEIGIIRKPNMLAYATYTPRASPCPGYRSPRPLRTPSAYPADSARRGV